MKEENDILEFPELVELKAETEQLRKELAELILDKDILSLVVCKDIETAYMLAVGELEYEAYALQIEVQRHQRTIDMINEVKTCNEAVDLKSIEHKLDEEFDMNTEQLDAQLEKINEAKQRSERGTLSGGEWKELKDIYYQLITSMHPELNTGISDSELALYNNAVAAFERRDLSRIKIICEMVNEAGVLESSEESMVFLDKENTRLRGVIDELNKDIEQMKSEYPYSMKAFVTDKTAIDEFKLELEEAIDQFKDALIRYKAIIRDRMEDAK